MKEFQITQIKKMAYVYQVKPKYAFHAQKVYPYLHRRHSKHRKTSFCTKWNTACSKNHITYRGDTTPRHCSIHRAPCQSSTHVIYIIYLNNVMTVEVCPIDKYENSGMFNNTKNLYESTQSWRSTYSQCTQISWKVVILHIMSTALYVTKRDVTKLYGPQRLK